MSAVNLSLHQEIQLCSERLADLDIRREVFNIVNRSTKDVFEHIEAEIIEVRENILAEVLNVTQLRLLATSMIV